MCTCAGRTKSLGDTDGGLWYVKRDVSCFLEPLTAVLASRNFQTQNASASQRTSRVENGKSGPSAKVLERLGKPRLSPQAAAQEKLAKTGSLPWNLPAARSQGGSDMQGHREAVHKMLAGGR